MQRMILVLVGLAALVVLSGGAASASPTNLGPPVIVGDMIAGATLTVDPRQWSGSGGVSFSYQWQSCTAYSSVVSVDAPAGYWRLGEPSGTTAYDATQEADGRYNGTPTLGAAALDSVDHDKAVSFGGSGAKVQIDNAPLFGSGPFTVEAWFKTTQASRGGIWASGVSTGQSKLAVLDVNSGKVVGRASDGNSTMTLTSPGVYADGAWHHAAFERSGNTFTLYVDGAQVISGAKTIGAVDATASSGGAIASEFGSYSFVGSIDEVAVYAYALTADRVSAHSNIGRTPCTNKPGQTGPTYTLAQGDIGANLRVLVTGTDGQGQTTVPSLLWPTDAGPLADRIHESGELSTSPIVTGTVTDQPAAPGIGTVALYAWPPDQTVKAMQTGGNAVAMTPVAQAYVTPSGTFTLRPDPSVNLATFADSDGVADFMARYRGPSGRGTAEISLQVVPPARDADESDTPATISDLAISADGTYVPLAGIGSGPKATALRSRDRGLRGQTRGYFDLETYLVGVSSPERVLLGETYTKGPGVTSAFTYVRGSKTKLGVAVTTDSSLAGFHQNNTRENDSDAAVNFQPRPENTNYRYYTRFSYGLWVSYIVTYDQWGNPVYYDFHSAKSKMKDFLGGAEYEYADSPIPEINCEHWYPGTQFVRNSKQLVQYSEGVSVADFIGINLSSQTSASKKVVITYTFVSGGPGGWLCASEPNPLTAKRLRAISQNSL